MILKPQVDGVARDGADLSNEGVQTRVKALVEGLGPSSLLTALKAVRGAGGRPYLVGGSVRDAVMGVDAAETKDLDIEVFDISPEDLRGILARFGAVDAVGASFGVLKFTPLEGGPAIDFSLPRRESVAGRGHRGFQVEVDRGMTILEAAMRRDFSINAMSVAVLGDGAPELIDPAGGLADLRRGVLRATGPAFAEDPLRVLRGFQFAARFGLDVEAGTADLSRSLLGEYDALARERVWGEWQKWAEKGRYPSRGLYLLERTGWLGHYRELSDLRGCQQDAQWHPEGDVWVHTGLVCDEAAAVADREGLIGEDRAVILLAALCHDLGKPETTKFEDGRWRAKGHCEEGVKHAATFLASIGCPEGIARRVLPLVAEHLAHAVSEISVRMVRRLARRLAPATVSELAMVIEADVGGRPPLPKGLPANAAAIVRIASETKLTHAAPTPIVLGRHLISRGMRPGPNFGPILAQLFEQQLDGAFDSEDGGLRALDELLARP